MESKNISLYNIPLENVVNFSEYEEHRKFLECHLCRNLAIFPYYCERCNKSFCKKCIDELAIQDNKCPNCMFDSDSDLRVSNEKFYDFFRDLMIKCTICSNVISYPLLPIHECFTKTKINNIPTETSLDSKDEYQLINGIIYFKCKKCLKLVENSKREVHTQNCQVIVPSIPSIQFDQLPPLICHFCFKSIQGNQNDLINHLTECPQFISKINVTDKLKLEKQSQGNVLDIVENFNKFTKNLDTSNVELLIATMNNLEKTISNLSNITHSSYCRICKIILKIYQSNLCKCCNKRYCDNCCVPCTNCDEIISKNCQFTCNNCKITQCPLCQIQTGNFCFCLEHKICKTCFNDPNIQNINIALLKGPHVVCQYMKLLENNIYVVKIPKFNFRAEILMNSIKQSVSISLIKNGMELFSRIFQIGINDKLILLSELNLLKIGSSFDYWQIDLKSIEGGLDYMIINFNTNPNYSYVLNKLNSTRFDNLSPANSIQTGAFGMFNIGKQLIANIIFQKN